MRYVKQKHKNGCAIAAIAMLTGIGYDRVFQAIRPKKDYGKKYYGTPMDKAINLLNKFNCRYRIFFKRTGLKKLKNLKGDAYISINTPLGSRHAIVWDASKKRLLDPYRKVSYRKDYVEKHTNFIIEVIE